MTEPGEGPQDGKPPAELELAAVPVTGQVVPPPVDETSVARVLVRIEYEDGRIREYEADNPQDFQVNDPEHDVSFRRMGMTVQSPGSPRVTMLAAVPRLRLSFRGGARSPMQIRTERTAPPRDER